MTELIIKMALCLVVALILGFIFGWLLSKTFGEKRYKKEIEHLTDELFEKKDALAKKEKIHLNAKEMAERVHVEKKDIQLELAKVNQLLILKERDFIKLEQMMKKSINVEEYSSKLAQKDIFIKELQDETNNELQGFERVLLKAEKMIEERDSSILELKKKIDDLNEDLKEEELLITKDQFIQIEGQLLEYQKEIKHLKEKNEDLIKITKSNQKMLFSTKEENSELDDSAIVKLFGDTYKKITKS